MLLGVLSDTHGRFRRTAHAVDLLRRLGATHLVHCGDIGDERVIDALAPGPAHFVWGNTDPPSQSLVTYAASLGVVGPPEVRPLQLHLAGRDVLVFHGHEPEFGLLCRQLAQRDRSVGGDYVLYGHTHHAACETLGGVTLVNPGALHRALDYTVATINLARREVRHWRVVDGAGGSEPQPYAL